MLHRSAEKRLLSLVSRARVDASDREGIAVRAVLGEFVAQVNTLKHAGELGTATAARLERTARATAAQAAAQLDPTTAHAATEAGAGKVGSQTSTSPAADPATSTAPTSSPTSNPPPAGPGTKPTPPAGEKKLKPCRSPKPDHHHPHGKGPGPAGFGHTDCQTDGQYGSSDWGNGWNGGGGD